MGNDPIALCPLTTRVDAVYLDDDGSIFRSPVLALAIYRFSDNSGNCIQFVEGDSDGLITNPTSQENFLGLEFDRKIREWDIEIERLRKKRLGKL